MRKAQTQAIRHLVDEKRSKVFRAKVDEAVRELTSPQKAPAQPWEVAIRERQRQVRRTYADVADDLTKARDETSKQAAVQLQQFLKSLPPLETERHKLRRELATVLEGQGRGVAHDEPNVPPPSPDPGRDRER